MGPCFHLVNVGYFDALPSLLVDDLFLLHLLNLFQVQLLLGTEVPRRYLLVEHDVLLQA